MALYPISQALTALEFPIALFPSNPELASMPGH